MWEGSKILGTWEKGTTSLMDGSFPCMCSRLIRSYVTLSFAICSIVTLTSFFFAVHLTYVSSITLEHHFLFFFFVDEDKWKTEARTELGAIQDYTISYQNLVPDTSYTFRVIAYNKYGISYPAKSNDEVSAYLIIFIHLFTDLINFEKV